MNYKIVISEEQDEDIIILAKKASPALSKIEEILSEENDIKIYGYTDSDAILLNIDDIFCFSTEGGRVYAITENKKLLVRERIYRLEDTFSDELVKINQSCLIAISKIERFRTTLGGSLQVILKNGYTDFVSRRQIKEVKRRMGI